MTASETEPRTVVVHARTTRALPTVSGGAFGRLLRFAVANVRRRPERFVLAVLGIALAIAAVTVVRTISASFAITGADSVARATGGAHLWVVPPQGVVFDSEAQALVARGAPVELDLPAGYAAHATVAGLWTSTEGRVAVYGSDALDGTTALAGSELAHRLGLTTGEVLDLDGHEVTVTVTGDGPVLRVADDVARAVVGDVGWTTVTEPSADRGRTDLGRVFGAATGLPATTDPTVKPEASGRGLVYATVGGRGPLTFDQRYAAIFSGQVTSSTLGLISIIGLLLGFVIAVSSFLSSVQERRREFGIMSSIGLADEVLYFFLVESGLVFLVSWAIGVAAAGVAVWLVIPGIATPVAWLQAAGMVLGFVPAMAIVGALVPVHRLLQQRPVHLLAD